MSLSFIKKRLLILYLKIVNRPVFEEELFHLFFLKNNRVDVHEELKKLCMQKKVCISFRAKCPYCQTLVSQLGGQVTCIKSKKNPEKILLVLRIGQNFLNKLRFRCTNPQCRHLYTGEDIIASPDSYLFTITYIRENEKELYY